MTPYIAKKVADKNGYHFYWDYSLQLYTCYPKDELDVYEEASYHTKHDLANITEDKFVRLYLGAKK